MLRFEEYMSYKQQVCDRLVVRGAQMKRQYGPNAHALHTRYTCNWDLQEFLPSAKSQGY